jgi:dihydroorotase
MKQLFRQLTVYDPASDHHGQRVDLLVSDGRIVKIAPAIDAAEADSAVDFPAGTHVSPGWVDIGTYVGDPGQEQRETLDSLAAAAAAGGYTRVVVLPNTEPQLHDKGSVQYIVAESAPLPVYVHPLGAISHGAAGKEITEMIDMHRSGAVGFTDGLHPVAHTGLMLRALQYVKTFDGLILHMPLDRSLVPNGQLHEGALSTSLGLPGIPTVAETVTLARDIRLLAYSGSRLHVQGVASAEGVELIRWAKAQGLRISAATPVLNLLHTDAALHDFDSNYKVLPPLRSETDRAALRAAVADGTIDLVYSNHLPLEPEAKDLEYPFAEFGAEGLETAYAALRTALGEALSPAVAVRVLSAAPRRLLGLPAATIAVDTVAELSFFRPDADWTPSAADLRSLNHNNPLLGASLRGRPVGIFAKGQLTQLPS